MVLQGFQQTACDRALQSTVQNGDQFAVQLMLIAAQLCILCRRRMMVDSKADAQMEVDWSCMLSLQKLQATEHAMLSSRVSDADGIDLNPYGFAQQVPHTADPHLHMYCDLPFCCNNW